MKYYHIHFQNNCSIFKYSSAMELLNTNIVKKGNQADGHMFSSVKSTWKRHETTVKTKKDTNGIDNWCLPTICGLEAKIPLHRWTILKPCQQNRFYKVDNKSIKMEYSKIFDIMANTCKFSFQTTWSLPLQRSWKTLEVLQD